jgi:hypothetical protein
MIDLRKGGCWEVRSGGAADGGFKNFLSCLRAQTTASNQKPASLGASARICGKSSEVSRVL